MLKAPGGFPALWRMGGGGAGGKPPAFLPEYLYPVGFFANYGPKVSKGERREASIQWIQPPKAVSDPGVQANNKRDARQCGPRRLFAPRKALWCARRRIPLPPAGIDAPTPAREKGLQPYGALDCFGWRTVGGAGGRAESPCFFAGIFISRWFFRQLRPEGFQRASGKPFGAPAGAYPCPRRGMTRRLRRGRRACSPMGRSHFSFGGERKVCKRKPAARRLREKGFYCPFWRRGSLCRAQWSWPAHAYSRARSELAFFRRQNGRAFFPPLPIAALLPRSWRRADLPLAG